MEINDRIRIMLRAGLTGRVVAAILDADPADIAANEQDPENPVGVGGGGGGGGGGVLGQGDNVPVVAPDAVMSEAVMVAPALLLAFARGQLDLSAVGSVTATLLMWAPGTNPDDDPNPVTFPVVDAFREEAGSGQQYVTFTCAVPVQAGWQFVLVVDGELLGVSCWAVPLG